jgi:glycosyltransferase involved in cell wall biosynthesis
MKVLLLSRTFPNAVHQQQGLFNLQQAKALSKYCEVRVASPVQWSPLRLSYGPGLALPPRRDVVEGLQAWHPRFALTPRIGRDTHALQFIAQLLPALSRIRREYPFDVLWATWAFPDVVFGAVLSRLWNVPMLAKVHGNDINLHGKFPLRRRQIRWGMSHAYRILAVSDSLRQGLMEIGIPEERIMVCHNGIDTSRFHLRDPVATRKELGLDPEGKHIVFVGYLIERKGVDHLVEAVGRLKDRWKSALTVHLVGSGPLEASLRQQAAALGLESVVRFHGERPHAEIPLWMGAADIFCLPSIREGCPNAILEALGSGRAVVSTPVDGIPEITCAENSILVPPADPEALAGGLEQALGRQWDPEVVLATAGRFSWDNSARAVYQAAAEALEFAVPSRSRQAVADA